MERRKFMFGLGSLATGSAAAIGTGAFTSITADRDAGMAIVGDANSPFLELSAPNTLENGEYAQDSNEYGGDQLRITMDARSDVQGTGLNPDAEHWFDNVFAVRNLGSQSVMVEIDDGNLDNSGRIKFYQCGFDAGPAPNESQWDGVDGDRTNFLDEGYSPQISVGNGINVGLYVDTSGLDAETGWESGSFTIETYETDENSPP